tara:strand:+ start:3744 stop:4526 length:783 start_codon:yes stop_codon:yes gene_type:complete
MAVDITSKETPFYGSFNSQGMARLEFEFAGLQVVAEVGYDVMLSDLMGIANARLLKEGYQVPVGLVQVLDSYKEIFYDRREWNMVALDLLAHGFRCGIPSEPELFTEYMGDLSSPLVFVYGYKRERGGSIYYHGSKRGVFNDDIDANVFVDRFSPSNVLFFLYYNGELRVHRGDNGPREEGIVVGGDYIDILTNTVGENLKKQRKFLRQLREHEISRVSENTMTASDIEVAQKDLIREYESLDDLVTQNPPSPIIHWVKV